MIGLCRQAPRPGLSPQTLAKTSTTGIRVMRIDGWLVVRLKVARLLRSDHCLCRNGGVDRHRFEPGQRRRRRLGHTDIDEILHSAARIEPVSRVTWLLPLNASSTELATSLSVSPSVAALVRSTSNMIRCRSFGCCTRTSTAPTT